MNFFVFELKDIIPDEDFSDTMVADIRLYEPYSKCGIIILLIIYICMSSMS